MTQLGSVVQSVSTAGRVVNGSVSSAAVLVVAAKTAVFGPEVAALAAVFTGIVLATVSSACRQRLEKETVNSTEMSLAKEIGLQLFGRIG